MVPYGHSIASSFSTLALEAGVVLRQIVVGEDATGISLSPAGDRAFVALRTGDLAVLDTATVRLLRTVHVGETSDFLPAFVSHGHAYVMSVREVTPRGVIDMQAGGMLRVLDAHDGTLLRTIAVGQNPSWPPLEDVAGGRLFFTNGGALGLPLLPHSKGAVSVVDASTGTLVRKIPVGIGPSLITLGQSLVALDPATRRLLVLNAEGDGSVPPAPGDTAPICSLTALPPAPTRRRAAVRRRPA